MSAAAVAVLGLVVDVSRRVGVAGSGYRVVANTGPDSGRRVAHLHRHVLGHRRLGGLA